MLLSVTAHKTTGRHREEHFKMTQEERFNNEQIWKSRMQEYRASGLTQHEWCEREGINHSGFRYWLRRLREEETKTDTEWLKVCVNEEDNTAQLMPQRNLDNSQAQATANMRIHIANITIELPIDTPIEYVSSLLRVVRQG